METTLQLLMPWSTSIGVLCFFIVLRYIYRRFLFNMLHRFAVASSFPYDEQILEAFENPINVVLAVGGIYSALIFAPIPLMTSTLIIDRILRSTIVLSFFWGCYNLSDTTHGMMLDLFNRIGIRTEEAVSNIFSTILRIIIVVLGFVTIAKEWNYDISGFVASLGIGSLAIAFAAKDSLANVFGSLIIIWISRLRLATGLPPTASKARWRKFPSAAPAYVLFPRSWFIFPIPCCPIRPLPISPCVRNAALILFWA